MGAPQSPYELVKRDIDLEELSPGSIVAFVRYGRRAYEEAERARVERGVPLAEGLPISEYVDDEILGLPQTNLPHARAVYQAFAESPLAEDRIEIADKLIWLTPYSHDFAYGLWHRLARDAAPEVRRAATDFLRRPILGPNFTRDFDISVEEGQELIRVAEQVDMHEIPPFDLGQETLAVALGHSALPDWLRAPNDDA